MGYRTYHTLKTNGDTLKFREELEKLTKCGKDTFEEKVKWYDHEKDMREFSKKYPKILFSLYGEGEDYADYWVEYYQDGKMQRGIGEIVYPSFNPKLLKEENTQ